MGDGRPADWDVDAFLAEVGTVLPPPDDMYDHEQLMNLGIDGIEDRLLAHAEQAYDQMEASVGEETMRDIERWLMLRSVDSNWVHHLTSMENLRQGIGLYAYGQRDPLVMYKKEGMDQFQNLQYKIQSDIAHSVYRLAGRAGWQSGSVERAAKERNAEWVGESGSGAGRRRAGPRAKPSCPGRAAEDARIRQSDWARWAETSHVPAAAARSTSAATGDKDMTNGEIAERFGTIVSLLQMKGEKSFTVRAYQRAERTIERFPRDMDAMVAEGEDLTEIPGVARPSPTRLPSLSPQGRCHTWSVWRVSFPKAFWTW